MTTHKNQDHKSATHTPHTKPSRTAAFFTMVHGKLKPVYEVCDPVLKVCYSPFTLHWEKKYKGRYPDHAHKLLVLDMFLLAVIAALITGGIFSEQVLPSGLATPVVQLDLEAPSTVTSGVPVDLTFRYDNISTIAVGCVQLTVHLPPDTIVTGPVPALESSGKECFVDGSKGDLEATEARHDMLVFPQSDLASGDDDAVTVRATMYGGTGDRKTVWAELSYWEESKTEATRVSLRREWEISGATFTFDVEAPEDVTRGQTHAVHVRYANRGADVLAGAIVRVEPPADFSIVGYSPAPTGRTEWRLGDLAPGETGTVSLYGYYRSLPASQTSAPTFVVRGFAAVAGEETLVQLYRENTDPRASELSFALEMTEPNGRQVLLPGETVLATVRYRNDGDRTLRDLAVQVEPGAPYVTEASGPFVWDKKSDPALSELLPGAEGVLTTRLVLPSHITKEMLGVEPFPELYVSANASYRVDGDITPVRVDTQVIHLPISGHLELDGVAAYYTSEGDQIGTGPLPPKLGATTKYRVILSPSVTTSDVRGLTVEARLPENVEWTGRTSVSLGGAIDFLPSTRTVRWRSDLLPAWTGKGLPPAIATFEVAVTPTTTDVGKPMIMAEGITAHGTDGVTGLALHAELADITTEIKGDPRISGNGSVAP